MLILDYVLMYSELYLSIVLKVNWYCGYFALNPNLSSACDSILTSLFWDKIYYSSCNTTFIYSTKFFLSILFLIFIRAGIPRYRYDYLTLLGWNRFLFLTLLVFGLVIIGYFIN